MSKKFIVFCIILSGMNNCYSKTITVGDDIIGEGTVFCVSDTKNTANCRTIGSGKYGLAMANEDQSNFYSPNHGIQWSKTNFIAKANFANNGAKNTKKIIKYIKKNSLEDDRTNNAAILCHEHKGGNAGWYLPSRNELNKMYEYAKQNDLITDKDHNKKKVGKLECFIGGAYEDLPYWSSTEPANDPLKCAESHGFGDSIQAPYSKLSAYLGVRAIKAVKYKDLNIEENLSMNNLFKSKDIRTVLSAEESSAEESSAEEYSAKESSAEEYSAKEYLNDPLNMFNIFKSKDVGSLTYSK